MLREKFAPGPGFEPRAPARKAGDKKMPLDSLSHFDEKSGIISCSTDWGFWWQTVHEIHIEVNLPENTKAKEVSVKVTPNEIDCIIHKKAVFKGRLFSTVHPDETVWTIEDNKLLNIVLAKADVSLKDEIWESLLEGDMYKPDPYTLHEMRKKMDLEKFQIEGRLAKCKKCGHEVEGQVARMKKHLFKCSSSFTNENDSKCEGEELPGIAVCSSTSRSLHMPAQELQMSETRTTEEKTQKSLESGSSLDTFITRTTPTVKWNLDHQNPGFDFSRAKLSKCYDRVPGWSQNALKEEEK